MRAARWAPAQTLVRTTSIESLANECRPHVQGRGVPPWGFCKTAADIDDLRWCTLPKSNSDRSNQRRGRRRSPRSTRRPVWWVSTSQRVGVNSVNNETARGEQPASCTEEGKGRRTQGYSAQCKTCGFAGLVGGMWLHTSFPTISTVVCARGVEYRASAGTCCG